MPRSSAQRRLRDLIRHNRKLSHLCRLTAEVARLGDERTTLQRIIDTAALLVNVQGAHLALVDKNQKQLYGLVSSGRHPRNARRLRLQLSQSYAAREALRTCRPVAINRAADDARVNPRARSLMGIRGVAYLPLLSGDQSFGLLILVTRRPHVWRADELDLAMNLANVAAVALENTRLLTHLAETEGRLRSLIEHIPAIVYVCDVKPPYRTQYISPQVHTMLGYSPEEWTGDPDGLYVKLVHPEDLQRVIRNDRRALKQGFARVEYRLLDSRGEARWFRDEAVLVRDPAGTPIAWHGVLVEITGLRKMTQH
jgi:PAS domain S-box-containing protein